jgi:phage baseplate assembly protein W
MNTQSAISLPFSLDSFGNIAKATTPQKFWGDRVRSVIGTALRERVMQPDFGTNIPFTIFNNQDQASVQIQNAVEQAFPEWLPSLDLGDVTVTTDDVSGEIKVLITYSLPDKKEVSTEIGFVSIDSTNPFYEEISS